MSEEGEIGMCGDHCDVTKSYIDPWGTLMFCFSLTKMAGYTRVNIIFKL